MQNTKSKKRLGFLNSIILAILIIYVASMAILLLWGISTSLKTFDDYDTGNVLFLPSGHIWQWGWDNFARVIDKFKITPYGYSTEIGIGEMILNTVLYSIGGAFITTACSCIVAYCVCKFNYAFSKIVYAAVLIIMVIPIIGSQASMILFLSSINLYDTWLGTFIMKFNFINVYFMLMYAAFKVVPNEIAEAATIDGAGELQIFIEIMVPMILPTFTTIFLIYFIEFWNDYQMALLYMPTHPTLAYGVYYMKENRDPEMSREPLRLASCVIMALPILIIFVALRDKIMGNVSEGGVKE